MNSNIVLSRVSKLALLKLFAFFLMMTNTGVVNAEIGMWDGSPEDYGIDSSKLALINKDLKQLYPDIYSLLIVKDNHLVVENYYPPGRINQIAPLHSVTKSISSILIGIALDKKYLRSVDQKLSEFFPEIYKNITDPAKKDLTIKHVLTMSTGFRWNDLSPVFWEWYYSSDFVRHTLNLEQSDSPGSVFNYNSAGSHILSGIISKSTGMSALAFAKKHLFGPLEIDDVRWPRGPQGFNLGGAGLLLSSRSLAKIGNLMLNNGLWNGKRVVSEEWVRQSTMSHIKADSDYNYGYQWWVKSIGGCKSYRAIGRGGQYIVNTPALDLTVVVTSKTALPRPPALHYSEIFDRIVDAVEGDSCKNGLRPVLVERNSDTEPNPSLCSHQVKIPDAVSQFLSRYCAAFKEEDLETALTFYSESFQMNGRDKAKTRPFLNSVFKQMDFQNVCIELDRFEQKDNIADISGTLVLNSRRSKLIIPKIINEEGQWKWFGAQKQNRPVLPVDVSQFLEEYSASLLSDDRMQISQHFADNFSSRGFDKESFLNYILPRFTELNAYKIVLTYFERDNDIANVEGIIQTDPWGIARLRFGKMIVEDGTWKWLGN